MQREILRIHCDVRYDEPLMLHVGHVSEDRDPHGVKSDGKKKTGLLHNELENHHV